MSSNQKDSNEPPEPQDTTETSPDEILADATGVSSQGQENATLIPDCKKTVRFGPSPDIIDDDEAPIPIGAGTHADKDAKKSKDIEVKGIEELDACLPANATSYDDSLSREKHKMKANAQEVGHESSCVNHLGERDVENHANSMVPDTTNVSSCPAPRSYAAQDPPLSSTTSPTRQTELTAATTQSSSTIYDAYSQRASTVRYTEGDEIFIPEATVVDESAKEDIPSAEVVVPENYSITIAGKKVHAGVLVLIVVIIVVLSAALSVSLTRPPPVMGVTGAPSISRMPSQSPSSQPSSTPSSELYSSLVETIYGGDIDQVNWNAERKAAMKWLEEDQANSNSTLSEEEIRERYALALLYFVSNKEDSWHDNINFLSQDHVCDWRIKRSGEKKGVLVCSNEEEGVQRVLELVLYGNSLKGTLPAELSFLTELQVLQLHNNRIQSTIPDALGSLSMLSQLILNSNSLTGTIPQTIGSLSQLTEIYLSDNMIRGELIDVDSLKHLHTFKVDGNNLSGEIPESFGHIDLEYFYVNRNRLVGSMDHMCNNLPSNYKMDCDGSSPEVTCRCCEGCTFISDEACEPNEVLAYITVATGEYSDALSWQLYEVATDEWDLLAAGGAYDTGEQISFQLCMKYPGSYMFQTMSNNTKDSGASIEASIGERDILVGSQDVQTFILTEDGSLEVTKQNTSPSPTSAFYQESWGFNTTSSLPTESLYPIDASPGVAFSYSSANCLDVVVQLETDYFGDETSWEIVNVLDGAVVASRPRGSYASNSSYYELECLESDGCYSFAIYDQWSDGICCEAGNGVFNISTNNRFLYEGGDFKASDTVVIGGNCSSDVPASGICPNNESPLNVTIRTDGSSWETSWEVYDNTTGQIYFLNSGIDDNPLQITSKCVPQSGCTAFAIYDSEGNGFNETSDAFFEVSYGEDVVASGAGNFGYQDVTYFGMGCSEQ